MLIAMLLALLPSVGVAFGTEYFKKLYANDEHSTMMRRVATPLIEDFNSVIKYTKKVKTLFRK